ncbi:MAG: MASE1 domain-containing protein [Nanoarchaeota archaeon]
MNKRTSNILIYLISSIAIAVIYFFAGKLGLSLAYLNESASPVWFSSGIAVVVMVLFGYRFLPSIFIGAFLVNFTTTPSIPVSIGIAIGNTLEAGIAGYLINRFAGGKEVFIKTKTAWKFFFIAIVAPIISALIGISSLIYGNYLDKNQAFSVGLTWWIGDVMGIIILFTLILALYHKVPVHIKKKRYLELTISFVILISLSLIIFTGWPIEINRTFHLAFLCFLPILWIAFRSCLRFTAIATFITSIIAIYGTIMKLSIFDVPAINGSLIILQIYIGAMTITSMMISICVIEYKNKINKQKRKH